MPIAGEVAIRDATRGDAPAIQMLYAYNVETGFASYEYVAPDLDELCRRIDALIDAGYPYLIAEINGAFAGYAYASSYRSRAGYRWTVENSVYVAPSYGSRGIGRRLMQTLIARCEALGYRQMIAVIGDGENAASIALHRALGFTHIGTFRGIGYKTVGDAPGRWLDSVQMQRTLGEGRRTPPK